MNADAMALSNGLMAALAEREVAHELESAKLAAARKAAKDTGLEALETAAAEATSAREDAGGCLDRAEHSYSQFLREHSPDGAGRVLRIDPSTGETVDYAPTMKRLAEDLHAHRAEVRDATEAEAEANAAVVAARAEVLAAWRSATARAGQRTFVNRPALLVPGNRGARPDISVSPGSRRSEID